MSIDINTIVPLLAAWVVFDLCRSIWQWLQKAKPACPIILPEDYWPKIKQLIESGTLDAMIAIQEAQGYTPEATKPVEPGATTPPSNNGHSDEDIESATAVYHAARSLTEQVEERPQAPEPVAVAEPVEEVQHVPVKERHTDPPLVRKRGRPFGSTKKKKDDGK